MLLSGAQETGNTQHSRTPPLYTLYSVHRGVRCQGRWWTLCQEVLQVSGGACTLDRKYMLKCLDTRLDIFNEVWSL